MSSESIINKGVSERIVLFCLKSKNFMMQFCSVVLIC